MYVLGRAGLYVCAASTQCTACMDVLPCAPSATPDSMYMLPRTLKSASLPRVAAQALRRLRARALEVGVVE